MPAQPIVKGLSRHKRLDMRGSNWQRVPPATQTPDPESTGRANGYDVRNTRNKRQDLLRSDLWRSRSVYYAQSLMGLSALRSFADAEGGEDAVNDGLGGILTGDPA